MAIYDQGRSFFHPGIGGRRYYLKSDERHTPEAVNEHLHTVYYCDPA